MNVKSSKPSDSYLETFDARGNLYNEAERIEPRARETERALLIALLNLEKHHVVVDAPAGGGYLARGMREYVDETGQIICIEPSRKFAEAIPAALRTHVSPLHELPLPDRSVDRSGSLAGLHHMTNKLEFFREVFRVLRPGGVFAVADVLAETAAARFLNGPVNDFTETGHRGIFLEPMECSTLLRAAGFTNIRESHEKYFWEFQSEARMIRYCQRLFGLVKATESEIGDALTRFFAIERGAGACRLPWSLVYGVGVKPA